MAVGPFRLWEELTEEELADAEDDPLRAADLHWLAPIYEALSDRCNMHPRDADDLFLWEVGVLLKVHRKDEEEAPEKPTDRFEFIRKRLRGEKPEVKPVDPRKFAAMNQALS